MYKWHLNLFLFILYLEAANMANMAHAAQRLVRVPVLYHEGQGGFAPPPVHPHPASLYYRGQSPPRQLSLV